MQENNLSTSVLGNKKIINAWTTYDLAVSVYNLVITATIFPIYYNNVTSEKDANGEVISNTIDLFGFTYKNTTLYDYSLAFAFLIVALLSPLLSGIADSGGSKKKFMMVFCYMGAAACSAMFFFTKGSIVLGLLLSIIACIGYTGSMVFYNAYLPEIAEPAQQDKISAKGFARGYWGSSILLIVNLVLIQKFEWFGFSDVGSATRFSFLLVGLWWFGFSLIPFYHLPGNIYNKDSKSNSIGKGYAELRKVWLDLKQNKNLTRYLFAFFIYSMGVQTVMLVANHFGMEEIVDENGKHMETGQLILTILIIQFVAILGAHLFSFISAKKGNIYTLRWATLIWSLVCLSTYLFVFTPTHFYITAAFVGLVMGGIQALSRSTYSKLLPDTEDHTSYFSFYDVCEKLSIVFGMALFGIINEFSDRMRTPIILLISFFVIGFVLLLRVNNKKI
ncbi:MAG: MFS transporter [Bacteroidetes bacterium]|nr:MFS transporter [Bacteroidota bacterium]